MISLFLKNLLNSFAYTFIGTINGTKWKEHEECDPANFTNPTSSDPCPNAACMFYKYGPPAAATYMQVQLEL